MAVSPRSAEHERDRDDRDDGMRRAKEGEVHRDEGARPGYPRPKPNRLSKRLISERGLRAVISAVAQSAALTVVSRNTISAIVVAPPSRMHAWISFASTLSIGRGQRAGPALFDAHVFGGGRAVVAEKDHPQGADRDQGVATQGAILRAPVRRR